jgi:hypothetical protein
VVLSIAHAGGLLDGKAHPPEGRRDRRPLVDTGRHHHQHLLVRMQGDAQPECVGPCLHGARMNSGGHQEELAPLQRPNACRAQKYDSRTRRAVRTIRGCCSS